MGTLQISTSNKFANTVPFLKNSKVFCNHNDEISLPTKFHGFCSWLDK